jgi:hypothetical protein
MLTFGDTMDQSSLEIDRDGKKIGFIQWHSSRPPRVVLHGIGEYLSLEEMSHCVELLKRRIAETAS